MLTAGVSGSHGNAHGGQKPQAQAQPDQRQGGLRTVPFGMTGSAEGLAAPAHGAQTAAAATAASAAEAAAAATADATARAPAPSTPPGTVAQHPLARFFVSGRFADAVLRVRNLAETAYVVDVPVHRIILASQSHFFDTLFAQAPEDEATLSALASLDPSHENRFGVWSIAVQSDSSIRIVLEWAYLRTADLSRDSCWGVFALARRLNMFELEEHVGRWISENLLASSPGKRRACSDWFEHILGALRAGVSDDVVDHLIESAINASAEDMPHSAPKVPHTSAAKGGPDALPATPGSVLDGSTNAESARSFHRYVVLRDLVRASERMLQPLPHKHLRRLFRDIDYSGWPKEQLQQAYMDGLLPRDKISWSLARRDVVQSKPRPASMATHVAQVQTPAQTPMSSKPVIAAPSEPPAVQIQRDQAPRSSPSKPDTNAAFKGSFRAGPNALGSDEPDMATIKQVAKSTSRPSISTLVESQPSSTVSSLARPAPQSGVGSQSVPSPKAPSEASSDSTPHANVSVSSAYGFEIPATLPGAYPGQPSTAATATSVPVVAAAVTQEADRRAVTSVAQLSVSAPATTSLLAVKADPTPDPPKSMTAMPEEIAESGGNDSRIEAESSVSSIVPGGRRYQDISCETPEQGIMEMRRQLETLLTATTQFEMELEADSWRETSTDSFLRGGDSTSHGQVVDVSSIIKASDFLVNDEASHAETFSLSSLLSHPQLPPRQVFPAPVAKVPKPDPATTEILRRVSEKLEPMSEAQAQAESLGLSDSDEDGNDTVDQISVLTSRRQLHQLQQHYIQQLRHYQIPSTAAAQASLTTQYAAEESGALLGRSVGGSPAEDDDGDHEDGDQSSLLFDLHAPLVQGTAQSRSEQPPPGSVGEAAPTLARPSQASEALVTVSGSDDLLDRVRRAKKTLAEAQADAAAAQAALDARAALLQESRQQVRPAQPSRQSQRPGLLSMHPNGPIHNQASAAQARLANLSSDSISETSIPSVTERSLHPYNPLPQPPAAAARPAQRPASAAEATLADKGVQVSQTDLSRPPMPAAADSRARAGHVPPVLTISHGVPILNLAKTARRRKSLPKPQQPQPQQQPQRQPAAEPAAPPILAHLDSPDKDRQQLSIESPDSTPPVHNTAAAGAGDKRFSLPPPEASSSFMDFGDDSIDDSVDLGSRASTFRLLKHATFLTGPRKAKSGPALRQAVQAQASGGSSAADVSMASQESDALDVSVAASHRTSISFSIGPSAFGRQSGSSSAGQHGNKKRDAETQGKARGQQQAGQLKKKPSFMALFKPWN